MKVKQLFEAKREQDYDWETRGEVENQELLINNVLDFHCKIGNCVREWRRIKHHECEDQDAIMTKIFKDYIDCFDLVLSIGLHLTKGMDIEINVDCMEEVPGASFLKLYHLISELYNDIIERKMKFMAINHYVEFFNLFIAIGVIHLGFTFEQIEQKCLLVIKSNELVY